MAADFDDLDVLAQQEIAASESATNGNGANSLRNLIERGVLDESGREIGSESASPAPPGEAGSGVLDIFVEDGLLPGIRSALEQYISDIELEGYQVRVVEFDGSAEELRSELEARWLNDGLEGALFVGDLPVQYFKSYDGYDADGQLVRYPHDLYFMDLDGSYSFNASGADAHVDGDGDVAPEIYVSRLAASQLGGLSSSSETELINSYFAKLHEVRAAGRQYQERAIWFADNDWAPYTGDLESLTGLYSEVTDIRALDETTVANYEAALQEDVETLIQQIHAWSSGLSISSPGGGLVFSADVVDLNAQPAFINLFNCSSADFTQWSNLASTYVFLSDGVLNTVGSTKTGSMLNFADFYRPQSAGLTLGQSFLDWFEMHAAATDEPALDWKVDWHYGMTMQGDPTMGPSVLRAILPVITGTDCRDRLVGTDDAELILGLGGRDRITALAGDDRIFGGAGRDTIRAGDGDDFIDGGSGRDVIYTGAGADTVVISDLRGFDKLYDFDIGVDTLVIDIEGITPDDLSLNKWRLMASVDGCWTKLAFIPNAYREGATLAELLQPEVPGDASTLYTLDVGSEVRGTLDFLEDRDWFGVELRAGVTYRFDLVRDEASSNPLPDPYFRLYDAEGQLLAANDDYSSLNSQLFYTPTEDARVFAAAGAYADAYEGGYVLSLAEAADFDAVPGDESTTAEIEVGGAAHGRIDYPGDDDWFRVELRGGTTYRFYLSAETGSDSPLWDPYFYLYDAEGELIGANDDTGDSLNSSYQYTPDSDELVFASARAFGDYGTGDYVLSVAEKELGLFGMLQDVPAYNWYHGCSPTTGGSIIGYWDLNGYPDLFDAEGWEQISTTPSVQDQISSPAHNAKYDPTPDNPTLPVPPYTSIADFMGTSVDPLGYGSTYVSNFDGAYRGYPALTGSAFSSHTLYNSDTGEPGGSLWEEYVAEIDAGRPVAMTVDSNGDGITDHSIPGIGYEDRGADGVWYAAYTTWSESETPIWREFRPTAPGAAWAVSYLTFVLPEGAEAAPTGDLALAMAGGAEPITSEPLTFTEELHEIAVALEIDGELGAAEEKILMQAKLIDFAQPFDDLFVV
ncbi:hypothetical protein AYJ57_24675 (plasmid) [Salipiger sp. CCB-MM3]|uniref:hypothetical protein n=1 Tax=Salipiger sp. CCB-MM3 TaxID=1792508 RepID=UPI00080A9634|nr:hypothetical protein [Salipiger sp. CCB-MM3]ANT63674.1 hypothetical protein AYJ57_24675 [Salipiger sp. CCB-MM3]